MPTSWATPSETDAAATPAIIRSFDGATAIGVTVLAFAAFPLGTANTLPCRRTGDTGESPSTRGTLLTIWDCTACLEIAEITWLNLPK
jgi:hypothetical protein